uniref:Uncharacterized protein n=1 Tax=Peronospora matthiolae TaxID=2874970 RepID=A0AAV1UMU0_9STRA
MKLVAGLVVAALAVTAARADQMQNLRSTEEEEATSTSKGKLTSPVGAKANEELKDDEDDLTADVSDLVDGKGSAGDDMKINILDLIGTGSNQVDLKDIIDAIKDSSASGLGDLSWLYEEDDPDGKDGAKSSSIFGKGAGDGKDDLSLFFPDTSGSGDHVDGAPPNLEDLFDGIKKGAGSSGDLSWLFADASKSEDPHGAKDVATKGDPLEESEEPTDVMATKASKATKSGGKEAPLVDLFDDGSNGLLGGAKDVATKGDPIEEDEDDEVDPYGAKGVATKGDPLEESEEPTDVMATKASKATKSGGKEAPLVDLFDDGSNGLLGGAKEVATKGNPIEEDEEDEDEDEDENVDLVATKGGDKATKASKATKSGGEETPLVDLFDDGSNGLLGGAKDVATKGDPIEEDEDDEVDPYGAKGVATKGDPIEEDEDDEVDPYGAKGVATKGDPIEEDEDDEVDPYGAKGVATKGDPLEESEEPTDVMATKASKATKSGGKEAPLVDLFDDGSNGLLGGAKEVATKGNPIEEDEEDEDEDEDENVDLVATKGGDKATKASKATKSGGEETLLVNLFDDGSNGLLGGANDVETTDPDKNSELAVLDDTLPIGKDADSPTQGPL